ncbi:beta-1,3-galactosyltransferase 1-like [Glandiceps talaboti]
MAEVWLRLSKLLILKMISSQILFILLFLVLGAILMLDLLNFGSKSDNLDKKDVYVNGHALTRDIKAWKDPRVRRSIEADVTSTPYWNIESLESIYTKPPKCKQNVMLLVLVTSAADHFDRRTAIRNTWAKDKNNNENSNVTWQTIFLIGRSGNPVKDRQIENEFSDFGDILLGDYVDTYRNLTLKVQHGMRWAVDNCQPQFLLKTDDDCFASTRYLTNFLHDHNRYNANLYAGSMFIEREVVRNRLSKWYVSTEDFAPSLYPRYASGTGYILSSDVLQGMVEAATQEKPFPVEDAYVGVLASRIGINLLNTGRFTMYNQKWRVCNYLYLLVIHGVSPEQQYLAYKYTDEAEMKCPGQKPSSTWD